jgi:hypothetical protein
MCVMWQLGLAGNAKTSARHLDVIILRAVIAFAFSLASALIYLKSMDRLRYLRTLVLQEFWAAPRFDKQSGGCDRRGI